MDTLVNKMLKTIIRFLLISTTSLCLLAQDSKENADFKLAVSLYNDKLYDLALEQFRNFVSNYPNSSQAPDARFYIGLSESKLGKHDDARLTFQNFALTYPNHPKAPEAWLNAGEECLLLNNYREAGGTFERVKTFYPKSKFAPDALFKAGQAYDKIGDKLNARRVLSTLIQEYKSDNLAVARLKLAELYNDDAQYEQARRECKKLLDETNDQNVKAQALFILGKALIGLERYSEAQSVLSEKIQKYKTDEKYYETLFLLGQLKIYLGDIEGALSTWKTAISESSKAPLTMKENISYEVAELLWKTGNYAEAINFYELCGKFGGSRKSEAFFKAGLMAECEGNSTLAAQDYSMAVKDTNGSIIDEKTFLFASYKSAILSKRCNEAFRYVSEFVQRFPADEVNLPELLFSGANTAYYELNDYRQSINLCENLIRLFPKSIYVDDATFLLAKSQLGLDNAKNALLVFEEMKNKYPSSELIPEVDKEIFYLKNFYKGNYDESVVRLAQLVGDVVSEKSKADIAYRLGEIYYADLKDYENAGEQYLKAINIGLPDSLQMDALLKRAKCYEMLALRKSSNKEISKTYLDKAVELYDSLLNIHSKNKFISQILPSVFKIKLSNLQNIDELRNLENDFRARAVEDVEKEQIYLALADAYLNYSDYKKAEDYYRTLIEKAKSKPIIGEALFNLGNMFNKIGNTDSAVVLLDRFLNQNPNHYKSAESADILAKILIEKGQYAKALKYIELIEDLYYYTKYNEGIESKKGDLYVAIGNNKVARECYEQSLKKIRNSISFSKNQRNIEMDILYKLGLINEKLGNYSDAKKNYLQYVTMDQTTGRAAKAYYSLANIARSQNIPELSIEYMQHAGKIETKTGVVFANASLEAADMMFDEERYQEAVEKYNIALTQAKDDTTRRHVMSRIAICYFRMDNIKEAEVKASEFGKLYKKSDVYDFLAEFEFERGKYYFRKSVSDKAMEYFRKVVRNYGKAKIVPEALYWLARVYELEGKTQEAISVYDSILNKYNNSPIIYRARLSLGNVYYNLEKPELAAQQYKSILENEKSPPNITQMAMSNLIMTYKDAGLYEAALDLARKYIERYPDDPEIIDKKIDIGVIYQKLGYYDQSVLHLQSLIDAGNSSVEAELRYYIGEAYFYKGDYQQAIIEFLKVPYLAGRRGKMDWISAAYYMAGQSYEKMAKFDQAITMYQQIIERKDTDSEFKVAAQKEINRVKKLLESKK